MEVYSPIVIQITLSYSLLQCNPRSMLRNALRPGYVTTLS